MGHTVRTVGVRNLYQLLNSFLYKVIDSKLRLATTVLSKQVHIKLYLLDITVVSYQYHTILLNNFV